ncbi:hypothetical protein N5T78_07885 [Aliarcobacter cryaerophilus]|uniref:hypothetical protein n=1 Tax=Aliarcobacter cryaerophilus TaxID=28198 RepID=UPI0021B55C97|nr:hypothetical protein [Aliarcobacter cryaerophilus]MCT7466493.1 hypothetical protein [Aliarcobacter cryaerophilus]
MQYNENIILDEDKERVIKKLYMGNKHLDGITKTYFNIFIKEPKLGKDYFKWVKHHFDYSIKEYSITHSSKTTPSSEQGEELTLQLLKSNNIPEELFHQYKKKVDDILQSYTDKEWSKEKKHNVLKKQLIKLSNKNDNLKNKLEKINLLDLRTIRFLNDILSEMKNAGVNQVKNNQYIIIENLNELYQDMIDSLSSNDFKEKKKYLKKLDINSAKLQLHKYIKKMMEEDYCKNPKDDSGKEQNERLIKNVKLFLFYLIYDFNKIDIFMINSILGYKYDEAVKFYQKLFLKDRSTGKNDNFTYHTDIINMDINNFYDRNHEAEYDKLLEETIKHKSLKIKKIKNDETCQNIIKDKLSKYNHIYTKILNFQKNLFLNIFPLLTSIHFL